MMKKELISKNWFWKIACAAGNFPRYIYLECLVCNFLVVLVGNVTHSHKTCIVLQKGRIIMYDPKAGILTDEEIVSPDWI